MGSKWKQPNAQKHGVFSRPVVIPGENPQEFHELLEELTEEWQPSGASEHDTVFAMAKAMWLKHRFQRFIEIKVMKTLIDPKSPGYESGLGLELLTVLMRLQPEIPYERHAEKCLHRDKVEYLQQKFPLTDFKSRSEQAQAVINEIRTVLLPAAPDLPELAMNKAMIESATTFSGDLFDRELTVDERLNAMIDRAIKRLIHIKAMKQMLGQASKQPKGEVVKLVAQEIDLAK